MVFITCRSKSPLYLHEPFAIFIYPFYTFLPCDCSTGILLLVFFSAGWPYYVPPAKKVSQEYPVSVIICAKNEASNLVKNLPGIFFQNYRTTHEVIVVNDNSEDESKYILEEFQKRFKNLNVIPLTQEAIMIPGKKFPLSMGIKSTRYEVVLLTDADCIPASDQWIQKMQEGYAPGIDVVLGYGAYYKKNSLLNKFIRFETFILQCNIFLLHWQA